MNSGPLSVEGDEGSITGLIASNRVEGTVVYSTHGEKLGSIDHLMIDKRSGEIRYAILEFGGFLGMGAARYPLPWSILKYDVALDGYMVPVSKDTLENAPQFEREAYPDYTEDYGRRIYEHYGAGW